MKKERGHTESHHNEAEPFSVAEFSKETLEKIRSAIEAVAEKGRQTFAIPDVLNLGGDQMTLRLDRKNPRIIDIVYPDSVRRKMAAAAAALMATGVIAAGPASAEMYHETISKHMTEHKVEEVTRTVEIPSGTTEIEIDIGNETIDVGDIAGFTSKIDHGRVFYASEKPSKEVMRLQVNFQIPPDRQNIPFTVKIKNRHQGDAEFEEAGMQGSWVYGKPISEFPANDWGTAYVRGSALEGVLPEGFKISGALRVGHDYTTLNANPTGPAPWAVTPTLGLAYWNPNIGELSARMGPNISQKVSPVLGKEALLEIGWHKQGTFEEGKSYRLEAQFAEQVGKEGKSGFETSGDVELGNFRSVFGDDCIVLGGLGGYVGGGDAGKGTADMTVMPIARISVQGESGITTTLGAGYDVARGDLHITGGVTYRPEKKSSQIKVEKK